MRNTKIKLFQKIEEDLPTKHTTIAAFIVLTVKRSIFVLTFEIGISGVRGYRCKSQKSYILGKSIR